MLIWACIFALILPHLSPTWRELLALAAWEPQYHARLQARASMAPLQPLIYWDLSKSNDASVLGEPTSVFRSIYDGTDSWSWNLDCHVVIKLPRGRVIDSPASALSARVQNGHVVGIMFLTSPRRMCADDLRTVMVWNITHLHTRRGADDSDAIRIVDRFLKEAISNQYAAAENFGSRDGEPSVDIRLSGNDDEWGFTLSYDLFWFE